MEEKMADKRYFFITYQRPIHLDLPDSPMDKGRQDLSDAKTMEDVMETLKRWENWFKTNKCVNIQLWEHIPASDVPVPLEK